MTLFPINGMLQYGFVVSVMHRTWTRPADVRTENWLVKYNIIIIQCDVVHRGLLLSLLLNWVIDIIVPKLLNIHLGMNERNLI
jgi:hypothetical protein